MPFPGHAAWKLRVTWPDYPAALTGGSPVFQSPDEAAKFILDNKIEMVDLKVVSLGGRWLHVTVPARSFSVEHFAEGVGYDGSGGPGFAKVESGDVSAVPDPTTAFVDPFPERPTLSFICDTVTADGREPFDHDPRTIARRAADYLVHTGIADQALFAPEFEFHLFDSVEVCAEFLFTEKGGRINAL